MRSPAQTEVNFDLKAETGAAVNAPILTGNIIKGPVTINCSLIPARNGTINCAYRNVLLIGSQLIDCKPYS